MIGGTVRLFLAVEEIGDRVVDAGPEVTVSDAVTALTGSPARSARSLRIDRAGAIPPPDRRLITVGLRSGDTVRVVEVGSDPDPVTATDATDATADAVDATADEEGGTEESGPEEGGAEELGAGVPPAATVHVLSGPSAGASFDLPLGASSIGRASGNQVEIPDPGISRRHASILVDATMLTVVDHRSTNGVVVEDRRITGPTQLHPGQRLLLGQSWLSVTHNGVALPGPATGQVVIERPARTPPSAEELTITLPVPPASRDRRGRGLLAVGRGQHKLALEQFHAAVDEVIARLDDGRRAERTARLSESPSFAEVATDVATRTGLWERTLRDPDGLVVRLGLAELPSRTRLDVPPGGRPELRARIERLPDRYRTIDGVPAVVDLRRAGSLALVGSSGPVRQLAYGLLGQLVALHGPGQVGVAYSGVGSDDWDWLKWLPHVDFDGAHGVGSETEVDTWAASLLDRSERSAAGSAVDRPAAVVAVIDGDSPLSPSLRQRLITEGPPRGVHPVFLAAAEADVPDQVGATVSVGADAADAELGPNGAVHGISIETADLADITGLARELAPLACNDHEIDGRPLRFHQPAAGTPRITVGPFRFGSHRSTTGPSPPTWSRPGRRLDLAALPHGADDSRLVLGTVKMKRRSAPAVFAFEPPRDGSLALIGGPRSGKTTALRSVAAAAVMIHMAPDELPLIYFFDVDAGLAGLARLPQATGAASDHPGRVDELVAEIAGLLGDRLAEFEQAGSQTLEEHRLLHPDADLRRVLVLVDEIRPFVELLESLRPGRAREVLGPLLELGGNLGVHLVFTAADRCQVDRLLADKVGRWLTLETATVDGPPTPGRAVIGSSEIRFATLQEDDSADDALARLAEQLASRSLSPAGR